MRKRVLIGGVLALAASVVVYAAASYPSSVKSFSTKLAGQTVASAHINDIQDEIVAVEGALLNGVAHALKPSSDNAQDLGTAGLRWGIARAKGLQLNDATTLTLATDAVTVVQSYHAIDTEAAAATDNCATLTAGTGVAAGFMVHVRAANVAHVVTMKDGTGNLLLNGDYAMSTTEATISLIYDGTNWRELGRSVPTTTTPALTLLKSGNGTSTAAGATDVDTIAITGLTANDRIIVEYEVESVTQLTAIPLLRQTTDPVSLSTLDAGQNIAAGSQASGKCVIYQRQSGATAVRSVCENVRAAGSTTSPTKVADVVHATYTTNWTGSWTLALRHGGVTAGGTFSWTWIVLKAAGQ